MSIERFLFAFGGVMVMLTSLLAAFHHRYWTLFALSIGWNRVKSSFTGFCAPRSVLRCLGFKSGQELAPGKA